MILVDANILVYAHASSMPQHEGARGWLDQQLNGQLLRLPGVHANLVPDAHLAALAIEHGLALCSADTDFARFPGLKWMNPLSPRATLA